MSDLRDSLVDLLAEHKVSVEHVEARRGPTTTLHTYRLGNGTKVSSFANLAKDMAVAVGQEEVRIHAPVKGTSLVGVEVPNETRRFPSFAFDRTHDMPLLNLAPLSFPVGVNQENRPVIASLTQMPHLLIAGQTGSGKSVALTTLITALIAQHSPAELRLNLVDPKRVELNQFENAPQVDALITDVEEVADMLDEVVFEMDNRYATFKDGNVRNIEEWNEWPGDNPADGTGKLPYIVVVVDELADLMVQQKKTVEPLLVRIAQLGRAAGIHLVLATQRPTRDVITGLVKANVPSRWAFAVASTTDSMVVLDQPGANALIGKGDSLWHPAGAAAPERVQSYQTPDKALQDVVQWAEERWLIPDVPVTRFEDEAQEWVATEDIIADIRHQNAEAIGREFDRAVLPVQPYIDEIDRSAKELATLTATHTDHNPALASVDEMVAILRGTPAVVSDGARDGEVLVFNRNTADRLPAGTYGRHSSDRVKRDPEADRMRWDPEVASHKGEAFGHFLAPYIAAGIALGLTLFVLNTIFGG